MKRRRALELITLAAAGAILLASCEATRIPVLNNFQIEKSTFKKLQALSHKILPISEEVMLENIGPVAFTLNMIDDCEKPDDIQAFVSGMEQFFEEHASIDDLTEEQLQVLMENNNFLQKLKSYNVYYYKGLEEYLTSYTDYEFVPGRFLGCVNV